MNRLSAVVWVVVIFASMFMLYKVKYRVQAVKNQVVDMARELEAEREALHVAGAEWAYLNRPERLQKLSAKYLSSSAGVKVDQVADVEAIPFPGQMQAMDTEGSIRTVSMKVQAR